MFGQMALLTLIYLGGFTYVVAIEPYLNNENVYNDPIEYTTNLILVDIYDLIEPSPNTSKISILEEGKNVKQVLALNPDFKYFIQKNDKSFTNTSTKPSHYNEYLQHIKNLESISTGGTVCANITLESPLDSAQKNSYTSMNICGGNETYFEFSGVDIPIPERLQFQKYLTEWFWSGSRYFIFSAVGVFVISIIIIMFNFRSINRVTKVAEKLDEQNLDTPLPVNGLPLEVQPLVDAINKMIGRVNESKQQQDFFISTAAHELRTPLTILRGRVDMLDEGESKNILVDDIRNLVSLVNQLLKLMRSVDSQQLTKTIDVVMCCKKVIADRAPYALDKNINISFKTELDQLPMIGDEDLLEIAIVNLLDNAVSFSNPGDDINVTIHKNHILQVSDQGPGIDPNQLATIFTPFAKFPSNRNGHGLGLAIVNAIVNLHASTVFAKNGDLNGAEFTIRFPLKNHSTK
jgi:signal transduction histidine kinase